MYAMQYELTLPADYDMGIIRHRVATRGAALDAFPGLGIKAYLIRERGVDGSTLNQYAPFYLWADTDGMGRFLWGGGGFEAIIESFGRPSVRHWTGAAFRPGPAITATPRAATRHTTPIPPEADPAEAVRDAVAEHEKRATIEGVHSSALAVDPGSWQLVHFTLWEDAASGPGEHYQVLHLSNPHMNALSISG
jgi:Domain of unknown function (DUF4865)